MGATTLLVVSSKASFSDRLRLKRRALSAFCFIVVAGLIFTLSTRFALIPPVGESLNPFHGLWKRSTPLYEAKVSSKKLAFKGLIAEVVVRVDEDQIKHIFAENDHDLYFAQGFVLASERLWQMES